MITGLIETEEELYSLLAKCKQACDMAKPGTILEEFTIIRRLPGNRPPFVQFIHGIMPVDYNPFVDRRKTTTRTSKTTKRKHKATKSDRGKR